MVILRDWTVHAVRPVPYFGAGQGIPENRIDEEFSLEGAPGDTVHSWLVP